MNTRRHILSYPRACIVRLLAAALAVALSVSSCSATGGGSGFGERGSPVHLTVGYQPHWTGGWSAVVMRDKELWKEYLPEGSTVEFQVGLQGSIIASAMLAGKQQIGYMGDTPSMVAVAKPEVRELSIVAPIVMGPDHASVLVVPASAPEFASQSEAIKWMDGKTVAAPHGSTNDSFARAVFSKEGVTPDSYPNQSLEVITTNLEQAAIQGASIWEPTATRLVEEGVARRVASGAGYGLAYPGFMVMSDQLLKERPDVARAWMNAELDAQQYLADPANAEEVASMTSGHLTGFTDKTLRDSLFKSWPTAQGGVECGQPRLKYPFIMTADIMESLNSQAQFLHGLDAIRSTELVTDAVNDEVAREVLKERGVDSPVAQIRVDCD